MDYKLLAKLVADELQKAQPPNWFNTAQLAVYVGLPEHTIAEYRRPSVNKGPAFTRVGKHIRYHRDDVDAWLKGLQNV